MSATHLLLKLASQAGHKSSEPETVALERPWKEDYISEPFNSVYPWANTKCLINLSESWLLLNYVKKRVSNLWINLPKNILKYLL